MTMLKSQYLFDNNIIECRNSDNVLLGLIEEIDDNFVATNHKKLQFIATNQINAERFLEQSYKQSREKNAPVIDSKQQCLF